VSGDIIQGIMPKVTDPELKLREQYEEALEFLAAITNRFVEGDRTRVIVVPGNHDVSAYHFERSLNRINIPIDRKKELATQLFSPSSTLRWSWKDFELYEIADPSIYSQRLAAFADFYNAFYQGTRTYDLNPERQLDIFDFPRFGLIIVGFSSCYNNDLYNKQGAVHPACIASAGASLCDPSFQDRLRIAVWHHNVEGPPLHTDYIDPDFLQNLIDRGFSLGFHGHQHSPQFLDTRFRYGSNRTITVISAGTLCGGPSYRYGRAYNVVELDTDDFTGRLHVREMQNGDLRLPIWGRRILQPNTSLFYEFQYDQPPKPAIRENATTRSLIRAQKFYESGQYREAADIFMPLVSTEPLARPLLLDCLVTLKEMSTIIRIFDPPQGAAEAVHLMHALWEERKRERLRELLAIPFIAASVDPSVIETRVKYEQRLRK
jgi:3',5'-cyclic AMP phosphodiesterase CpdA